MTSNTEALNNKKNVNRPSGASDPDGTLNRYEELMESYSGATEGLSSIMAHASIRIRADVENSGERDRVLARVSGGVAAPMLTGFVLWILLRAHVLGIEKLFFIARDGQILSDLSRRLARQLGLDIEMNYLYGSRQSWLLPSFTSVTRERLQNIFPNHDVDLLSPSVIFSRLNISREEIAGHFNELDLNENNWNEHLNDSRKSQLFDQILLHKGVVELIVRKASEARELMISYLRQQGLYSTEHSGFVDLGSGATLYHALAAVLKSTDQPIPHGFYLGMRRIPETEFELPEAYLFDYRTGEGFGGVSGLITFLEAVCSADHGSVAGYTMKDGTVAPTFSDGITDRVMDWGFPTVRKSIQAFADYLELDGDLLKRHIKLRPMLRDLQRLFWTQPTTSEAQVWGEFPMEDGWGSKTISLTLARPYRFADVAYAVTHIRSYRDLLHRHWWHEAALERSSPGLQLLIRFILRTVKTAKRIRHR